MASGLLPLLLRGQGRMVNVNSEVQAGGYYNQFSLARSSHEPCDADVAGRLWDATQALRGAFAR